MPISTAPATELTTAKPAEIDQRIAALNAAMDALAATSDRALAEATKIRDNADACDRGLTRAEQAKTNRLCTVAGEADRAYDETAEERAPLLAEFYRRDGWTRYYLVEGGHLHSDAAAWRCSRTPNTPHYWMPEHSGRSAEQMIRLAGDRVCTVCFPDAPVAPAAPTGRMMTPTEAFTAAHHEQKTRAAAARKAAQITTPDGQPLLTADGDLVKTENAANRKAMEHAYNLAFYGTHPSEGEWLATIDRMVAALAYVRKVSEAEVRDGINRKIAAKMRRENGQVLRTI